MSTHCSLVGAVSGVAFCHSSCRPASQACEVDFASTITEPVINKSMAEHMWVKRNPSLFTSTVNYPSNAVTSEWTLSFFPEDANRVVLADVVQFDPCHF